MVEVRLHCAEKLVEATLILLTKATATLLPVSTNYNMFSND